MVSRIVLLAAVAVAPAVQAFTPGQLAGAWFCESDGAIRWRQDEEWEKSPDDEPRIFYFQDPESTKHTLLEGSMYREWDGENSGLPKSTDSQGVDRLDRFLIRGTITSATTASVYLLPTLVAAESASGKIHIGKPGPIGTTDEPSPYAKNRPLYMGPGRLPAGSLVASSAALIDSADIFRLFQVDADHFTLEPPIQDYTGSNYVPKATTTSYVQSTKAGDDSTFTDAGAAGTQATTIGFGLRSNLANAYYTISTEKCVRGLPRKSEACSYLHNDDSDTDTLDSDEANRACRGNLYCVDEDNTNFKGECDKHKCCSAAVVTRATVASPSYYQPPYQYQNSYYPQYSSNYYGYNYGR